MSAIAALFFLIMGLPIFSVIRQTLYKKIRAFSKAEVAFYILPLIMIILVIGTLAQADIGLYAAQKTYFSSWFFWWSVFPFPGGYTLIGLLTLSLTCKFILFSEWKWRKSGIILSHLGALVLLIGGVLTAFFAQERYMIIGEGEETPFIYDYYRREMSISTPDGQILKAPFEDLKPGQSVFKSLPFSIQIRHRCQNCDIIKRPQEGEEPSGLYQGMARFMAIKTVQPTLDPETDIAGLSVQVSGVSEEQDGQYILFDGMPAPVTLEHEGHPYVMIFGNVQHVLPFSLMLEDFQEKTYPGSEVAQSFSSDVVLRDGNLSWPVRIEMNKPLRHKGYTFYQSSFERGPAGHEVSIFSVVRNEGRVVPYIGTALVSLGLLIHFILMLSRQNI